MKRKNYQRQNENNSNQYEKVAFKQPRHGFLWVKKENSHLNQFQSDIRSISFWINQIFVQLVFGFFSLSFSFWLYQVFVQSDFDLISLRLFSRRLFKTTGDRLEVEWFWFLVEVLNWKQNNVMKIFHRI